MSESPFPLIPGYELKHELGTGGMATVYLAVQTSLDRKVAIKVMHVSSKDEEGPERIEKRFLREGRMLARLSHRNVCGIYDIAKVGDIAYIAMEYLAGGTLSDRLRRGMTASDAISVIVQLAAALSAAHGLGVVHRDLKPANVMMRGKVPVLSDFGIARDLSPDRTEITGDSILGTPNYMSPEQISGKDIDGRADIYSLGAMLYDLLTGHRPYVGDSPIAVCMQHLQAPIPRLPESFAELQPVIEGMMAKDRQDRFPDMASVIVELRGALIDSTALRQALRLDTDVPWSEQLRELGFSFDTTGNDQVRAALQAPRTLPQGPRNTVRLEARPPMPTAPIETESPPAVRRVDRRTLVVASLIAGVLLALGLWWGLSEERLSDGQMIILRSLTKDFDGQISERQLVIPQDNSALTSLTGMYSVSRKHPEVLARELKFRSEVDSEVAELTTAAEFGEARNLLDKAALVFSEAELETRVAALDQAQETASRDTDVLSSLSQVETLLTSPQGVKSPKLGAALAQLVRLSVPTDPRYGDLINQISARLSATLQEAVTARELDTAIAVRDRLRALLPDADATRAADAAVERLGALINADATREQTLALLNNAPLTPAIVDQVLANLDALSQAGLEDAVTRVQVQLLERSQDAARRALATADLTSARALLAPLLRRFPDESSLSTLEGTLSQAESKLADRQRTLEQAQRAGRLSLVPSPWGEVISVVGADGIAQPLGDQRITPLLLTLPEGRYQVTIQGPDGSTRQKTEATVTRGQISVAELRFISLDADTYLKQAGYR